MDRPQGRDNDDRLAALPIGQPSAGDGVAVSLDSAIQVRNLRHTYQTRKGFFGKARDSVTALNGITLTLPSGRVYGLLGPNGAGKTTLIKILSTLLIPTTGSVRVLDKDVTTNPGFVRERIGVVFGGDRGLYWRLSASDNLRYFFYLYGLSRRSADERIGNLLELVGLAQRADDKVQSFSRGMKQRLHLARSMLHDPLILFLDEPTIGLDPLSARDIRKAISNLATTGKTILLTTHYMFEADELCSSVGVIKDGKIITEGTPNDLKEAVVSDLNVIEIEAFGVTEDHVRALLKIRSIESATLHSEGPRQMIRIQSTAGASIIPEATTALRGVPLGKVAIREPTLEDAYIRLIGTEE